ncbi:hypothetical protein [Streptomyces sp. I5]|uniref:hypothetical protein n=1 Tax=Streptomyces sp. I5 TaxID=2759947 RepID=UPI0018EE5FEC|nr:hypothetical protein [Streptomyces sp. I5]MBJ6633850.1 hypothetical protein [Streptomyces sp. I5]
MSNSDGNAVLVNALSSSIRSTLNGMETAPALIRRVLEEESWRSFTSPRGEQVDHDSFESFVTTAPTRGLGKTIDEIVRIAGDDENVLRLLAEALGVEADDLRSPETMPSMLDTVEHDAKEFGAYARAGGWHFGLMVARNVKPGNNQPSTEKSGAKLDGTRKVTAAKFAIMAGTGVPRVMRFYRAWERAAQAGVVPDFDSLAPGMAVDLPDPELWAEYFTTYERNSDRRESIAQQAEITGTSYAEALKVAERPGALRTAILGDAKTAEAARVALIDRMQDDPELQRSMAKTLAQAPDLKRALASESRRAERVGVIREVVEQGKAKTPTGQMIELPHSVRERASEHLVVVNDPTTEPEAIEDAYEAVQAIIIDAIHADPEIQTNEQRNRYHKTLSSTVRNIESIDPEDLLAVADDDLRQTISAAQKRINELAELLARTQPNRLRAV